MKKVILIFILIVFTSLDLSSEYLAKNISVDFLLLAKRKYGDKSKTRLVLWDKMVERMRTKKVVRQLKAVNSFFNKIKYMDDKKIWGKDDFWSVPFEFLGIGAGDSEDYAIAKYYTLIELGISKNKLKIVHVILTKKRVPKEHVVLNYYHKPTSIPIVLDNEVKILTIATKRKDLKPIYYFNPRELNEILFNQKTNSDFTPK